MDPFSGLKLNKERIAKENLNYNDMKNRMVQQIPQTRDCEIKVVKRTAHRVAMKRPLNVTCEYYEFLRPEIDLPKELAQGGLRSGIFVLTRATYSSKSKQESSQLLFTVVASVSYDWKVQAIF